MANNYFFEINKMDVIPSLNGLTHIVDTVYWKYYGVDEITNNIASVGWSTKLTGVTENTFINYNDLTQNVVESWLENVLNIDDLKIMVDNKIELLNNPPIINLPIPWE